MALKNPFRRHLDPSLMSVGLPKGSVFGPKGVIPQGRIGSRAAVGVRKTIGTLMSM
jgi:hypothetical protein